MILRWIPIIDFWAQLGQTGVDKYLEDVPARPFAPFLSFSQIFGFSFTIWGEVVVPNGAVGQLYQRTYEGFASLLCIELVSSSNNPKNGLSAPAISCFRNVLAAIERSRVHRWQVVPQENLYVLSAGRGRHRPAWSGVEVVGEGLFDMGMLTEVLCNVLVMTCIVNCQRKGLEEDEQRSLKESQL